MPRLTQYEFGGVSSRDNPSNFPPARLIRCKNLCPEPSGSIQLRYGYSQQSNSTSSALTDQPIHSAAYYEVSDGGQFIIYGQDDDLYSRDNLTGQLGRIHEFSNSNPWGHFRARGSLFLANGTDFVQFDGAFTRPVGIRTPAPNGAEAGAVVVNGYALNQTLGEFDPSAPSWTNPDDGRFAPDGIYATIAADAGALTSDGTKYTGYGFALSPTTVIKGIKVTLRAALTGVLFGSPIALIGVRLVKAGVSVSADHFVEIPYSSFATAGDIYLGDAMDLWSTGWTYADINHAGFGLEIQITGLIGSAVFNLDSAKITVYGQDVGGVSVAFSSNSNGSWSTTTLGGFQLGMAYYNPITGHVGNYVNIGDRLQNTTTTAVAVDLTNMPNLAAINPEWVKMIGRTLDGGQICYSLVDSSGNRIVVPNGDTVSTILLGDVNVQEELPTRNDLPGPLRYFSGVNSRIFGINDTDKGMFYCEDAGDVTGGNYVGNPEESWPADNFEASPTGERPTAIHGDRFETWLFSRNYLSIWSLLLQQQGTNPWRGPWPGGCAGQRAFVDTPYGKHWMTPDKQLMMWTASGPVPVSDEYEAGLLSKIADANIALTELGYLRDPENIIDRLYVLGFDVDDNPVVIVHDFKLRDSRSPFGQAYEYDYHSVSGLRASTIVGSGLTPRQNALDANRRQRLWVGSLHGRFCRLEDGNSDNGTTYHGDGIGILNLGPQFTTPEGLQIHGDTNTTFSYSLFPNALVDAWDVSAMKNLDDQNSVYEADIISRISKPRWLYMRFQLTAHPADGDFEFTDPPFSPMPTYGRLNSVALRIGAGQPNAR